MIRIPSGTTDQFVYFVASLAGTAQTGITGFTVYRTRNGGTAAAMTTPTINEVDSTNMPGLYELLADEDMTIGSGNDSEHMVFYITATGIDGQFVEIELYRPKATIGETVAVSSGAISNVTLVATTTTNTDMRGTDGANTVAPDNAGISSNGAAIAALNDISVNDILTTQMTESYAADNVAPSLSQALFLIQQTIGDFSITGTTITTNQIDGTTTAATYTLDDGTNPTSRTRTT